MIPESQSEEKEMNRKNLVEVLQAVRPGLAKREVIEQSTSFIFTKGQVLTYNDDIAVSHPIDLDIEGAVQAKELFNLLSKTTDEEVELRVEKSRLIVKGKKFRAGIILETKTNVKDMVEALGEMKKWETLPATFIDAIELCLFSTGKDMTKPLLTCVHCSGSDVVSGDGIRITAYDMGKKADMQSLNIPTAAARELKSYTPLKYSTTKGWVHFKTENDVVFSCRTFGGDYPKEKSLNFVDKAADGDSVKLPDKLSESLERAGIFSAGIEIKTITDDRVYISLESGKML